MAVVEQEKEQTLTVQLPASVVSDIESEARKMGLHPSSYLLALHSFRTGRADPSLAPAIREIFTHDTKTLKKLAE